MTADILSLKQQMESDDTEFTYFSERVFLDGRSNALKSDARARSP